MTEKSDRQDSIQRIQVGVIGLVAVLMLVSLANFVVKNASEEASAATEVADSELVDPAEAVEGAPAEPLAELGAQPAPAAEEGAPGEAAAPKPGQVVPDLEPDPKLKRPMTDQQR